MRTIFTIAALMGITVQAIDLMGETADEGANDSLVSICVNCNVNHADEMYVSEEMTVYNGDVESD